MKLFLAAFSCLVLLALAAPARAADAFSYEGRAATPAPIPLSEQGLQTVEAEPLKVVNSERHILEGAVFDSAGNLYFCDVTGGKVQKLTPDNELSDYVVLDGLAPCGLAFGPDGRLFMAVKNPEGTAGSILAVAGEGGRPEVVVGADKGHLPNDLVFDGKGGFYFSDCKGSSTVTGGGIVYVAPDGTVTTVIPDMAQANGVALSPDDAVIWATEYAREQLHKTTVRDSTKLVPFRSHIPYRFTGRGPDSMRVDADGNVYVAMMSQGRVLIFNPNGFPIGQILLPGRDEGKNLLSTSLAIHPEKKEVRIVTSNPAESASPDAAIFTAPAFAPGLKPGK
ncbi:MAG: SMP-30/gluconolactonase/LRE family protein [Desulfovibrio sp.]|nr:SMP-30/gluconolactonase/LRE family protein [Desulfovibrio sp.]